MLYRKPINKLQKFIQKRSYLHIGVFLATLLSIILFSWVALSQQPVILNLLMTAPDAQPWRQGLIRDFEAENPGIRINLVEGPNATNLLEDLYTSSFILGESPYDLINMDVIWTSKFAAAGWLLPLGDRISKEELAAFSSQDVEGGRYQDKLYRIPVRSDVGMLYYREDLIKQAGLKPPETFDDLIRISQVLQKKDEVNWGYVWQGRQYEGLVAMFAEVLDGFGGFWVNADTLEVGLDRPETLRAIEFLRSTVKEGVSPPGVTTYQEEDTRRLFQSGQVAFLRSWPYAWPLAQAENSPIRGKIAIKPMVHAPGQTGAACLGGWGLGISKTSRHPKEAWKAIQYFTSREAQRRFILTAGYVPSRRDLFTDPEIVAKYPHYPQLLEVVDNAVLRPPIAQYAQTSDILQRYLSAALSGRMNSERAMQAAAAETRRLLGAGGKQLKIKN
ncbi:MULTISPECIES: ABC transporter substrate-binding protein [Nostoc]|uniref:ABC transporter substrate-binding protein n=2 Tax=Nostoc TaxID=1177 RepID=A0ABR8I832_9NOSO|nr:MULTISPECIES: ABC transporter substrate-binding protein [Nostoc]MBD2563727.1 ABC transporter substrate-binding protein [Nostoc linckia FACHB-391]MBD2647233.1 ABC transporter substrate-binding protein [Nostoc foliaceum FACHB-393]